MSPKSSLGQNFLKNPGIVEKIIHFAEVSENDVVLEIGPGTGVLTARLLEEASRVIAVEKDDRLCEKLGRKFAYRENLELIHGDILESDLAGLVSERMKIVANLPYNIASQIILRLADVSGRLASVVVMVQKEVGMRICASMGQKDYSALTVILSAVFDASPGFIVGPKNFHPVPKVDSMVIRLVPKESTIPEAHRKGFRGTVFAAFGQRRKMLRNSLLQLSGLTRDLLEEAAGDVGISLDQRPQDLSWEDFYRLSRSLARRSAP